MSWFDDPHLFIYESADSDGAEVHRRAGAVAKRTITETSARSYFHRKGARLDPVEGIWYDRQLRVAIVPDAHERPGAIRGGAPRQRHE